MIMSHETEAYYPSAALNPGATSTLLALLLALKSLEAPLNKSYLAKLYEVGEQIELDPDDWEFIYDGLKDIVESNTSLNEIFQAAYARVLAEDESVRRELIPPFEIRGYLDNGQELVSREVLYVTTMVLKSDNPQTAARKLPSWINRGNRVVIERR